MRKIVWGIGVLVLMLVQCGCMSSRSYLGDRMFDAADVFTTTVGVGAGGVARVGPFSTGMFANTDLFGLRSGVLGIVSPLGPDGVQFNVLGWGFDGYAGYPMHGCVEDRSKQLGHKSYGFIVGVSQFWKHPRNYSALTQIEVAGGILGTLRLGFNPGELLDFVLGWLTIDIYDDDLSVLSKQREVEKLKQQEIRKNTKESERIAKETERASNIRLSKSTFVLQDGNTARDCIYINPFYSVCEIDILQRRRTTSLVKLKNELEKNETARFREMLKVDLKLSLKYDPGAVTCEVTFEMPAEMPGGFFKANNSLDMMPQNGYKRDPVSVFATPMPKKFFIYVKSRNPSIYTRVAFKVYLREMNELNSSPTRLAIRYEPCINPYGGRNLEPIWNLPHSVSKKLEKDAREALAKGELAEKPDLIKLLEEATAKYEVRRKRCQAREKERNRIIKEKK